MFDQQILHVEVVRDEFTQELNGQVRLILFAQDEETGALMVADIVEHDADKIHKAVRYFGEDELVLHERYADFDFGRATRIDTKVKKLVATLMAEDAEG